MTTWLEQLESAMQDANDPGPVIYYAPDEAAFHVQFNNGWGTCEGPAVLAWTETRVYFPVQYDGAEWMGSAPREPTPLGQKHVGNG